MNNSYDMTNAWFEKELRSEVPSNEVPFLSIETTVMRRIRECEANGILGLLCIEEIPNNQKMEQVERDLLVQITHYCEYDEPVNECLRENFDLNEKQWNRLDGKLDEKIEAVQKLPLWEQQLMSHDEEPTAGYWDAFEMLLLDRINRFDTQIREGWEHYEINDNPVLSSSLEMAEVLLDRHIAGISSRHLWEQVIVADKIIPMSKWENIEQKLFSSLDIKSNAVALTGQPFWFIVEHYASAIKRILAVGVAILVVTSSGLGIKAYRENSASIPTMVYQADGRTATSVDMKGKIGSACQTLPGGGITLVNSHGSIELRDQSALKIEKASQHEVKYSIDFSPQKVTGSGKAAFFVRKGDKRRKFSVATRYYNIEVKGTYFRVESDINGSVTTKVLEGKVTITGIPSGDTSLYAGQLLLFDAVTKKYQIIQGGDRVSREYMEKMPDIAALQNFAVVSFNCSEYGSAIYLNDTLIGSLPLKLRLASGEYRVVIAKKGFTSIDTLLSIAHESGDSEQQLFFAFDEKTKHSNVIQARSSVGVDAGNSGNVDRGMVAENDVQGDREETVFPKDAIAKVYHDAQLAERTNDWRNAVKLYKRVYNDPGTTPLRREDALFSIGKLQADHVNDIEVAKKTLLTYLALFPDGSFAGESWLRLAELEFRKNQENAVQYYLKFFKQFPRHPRITELRDRVGVIYLQQKHYGKAISMFEQALATGSVSEEALKGIATHLHKALLEYGLKAEADSIRDKYLLSGR